TTSGTGRTAGGGRGRWRTCAHLSTRRHAPLVWTAIAPTAVSDDALGSVTHAPTQPSAKPTYTLPCPSSAMSLKSSRLRAEQLPPSVPPAEMQPRCTGSVGVASTVVHVAPPS